MTASIIVGTLLLVFAAFGFVFGLRYMQRIAVAAWNGGYCKECGEALVMVDRRTGRCDKHPHYVVADERLW